MLSDDIKTYKKIIKQSEKTQEFLTTRCSQISDTNEVLHKLVNKINEMDDTIVQIEQEQRKVMEEKDELKNIN